MTKYVGGGDIDPDEEVVLDSNGNRITEARAAEMAEHAIRQVRAGRPSLTRPGRTPRTCRSGRRPTCGKQASGARRGKARACPGSPVKR